jgi:hypothetical protein
MVTKPVSDRPFDPRLLIEHLGCSSQQVCEILHISRHTMIAWNRGRRLSEIEADRHACAIGVHPAEIWPNWFTALEPA